MCHVVKGEKSTLSVPWWPAVSSLSEKILSGDTALITLIALAAGGVQKSHS